MPQPNQGKPAPKAHTSTPIEDKKGASKSDLIKTGVHPGGTKGSGK